MHECSFLTYTGVQATNLELHPSHWDSFEFHKSCPSTQLLLLSAFPFAQLPVPTGSIAIRARGTSRAVWQNTLQVGRRRRPSRLRVCRTVSRRPVDPPRIVALAWRRNLLHTAEAAAG
jgi:hypothetical protein